jgi:hypothetical protein
MHLFQGARRVGEILEGSSAKKKVERFVTERHRGSVAMAKVNPHPCFCSIRAGYLNKSLAYVQSSDLIVAEFRKFDGEIPRPGSDFEHATSGRNPFSRAPRKRFVVLK